MVLHVVEPPSIDVTNMCTAVPMLCSRSYSPRYNSSANTGADNSSTNSSADYR